MLLAIETSFDDTGLALLGDSCQPVFAALSSSVELHAPYGGVVPELAARHHLTNLPVLMNELLRMHPKELSQAPAVGVTRGPGLPGCLLAGISFARGAAMALGAELYGLNHLEGHAYSPFFGKAPADIPFPFLALVISGGNTILYEIPRFGEMNVLGETLDDAAGELFDKLSQKLGLGYPGGAKLEKLAREFGARPISREFALPVPMRESGDLNFSFSGLKTAAARKIDALRATHEGFDQEFAASLMRSVWDSVWLKVHAAAEGAGIREVSVSGGVAMNGLFNDYMQARAKGAGLSVHFPLRRLAMDNAEMMAYLLWLMRRLYIRPQPFDAEPGLV